MCKVRKRQPVKSLARTKQGSVLSLTGNVPLASSNCSELICGLMVIWLLARFFLLLKAALLLLFCIESLCYILVFRIMSGIGYYVQCLVSVADKLFIGLLVLLMLLGLSCKIQFSYRELFILWQSGQMSLMDFCCNRPFWSRPCSSVTVLRADSSFLI